MIRCGLCDRRHEDTAARCECGADLSVDGRPVVDDPFADADLGGALADLPDLPALDLGTIDDPLAAAESLPIPNAAAPAPPDISLPSFDAPPEPVDPSPPPLAEPVDEAPPPRRDFAVQPRDDSGETDRGLASPAAAAESASQPAGRVAQAPIVDPDLEHSVFSDIESERSDGSTVRDALEQDRSGGVIDCPVCGRELARDRHFCKCGREFDIPVREPVPLAAEPSRLAYFWRRLTGTGKTTHSDQRSWSQRARDTGARRGMSYATRMSGRTRLGRMGLVLAGGAGLIMALGPLRSQVRDLPGLFVPTTLEEISVWASDDCDAAARSSPDDPWVAAWSDSGGPSGLTAECDGVLSGTFAQPVDIARFRIELGSTSGQSNANLGQPVRTPDELVVVFIRSGDREPEEVSIDLSDNSVQQEFRSEVDDVTGFEIRVGSVQADHQWPELDVVQIGRIAFVKD